MTDTLPDYEIQPLTTRYARTATRIALSSSIRYFDDLELQEADHFDGYTVDVELNIPFLHRFELDFYYPIYTEGEARLIKAGDPNFGQTIDIEGDGGIFDWPSVSLEYQILKPESPHGFNLSAFGGYGIVLESLETSVDDLYNHKGKQFFFGARADQTFSDRLTGLFNLGGRHYYESDDIYPKDDGTDVFWFLDGSAALIWHLLERRVNPTVELVYQGDLGSYNNLHIDPQVIFVTCQHFEIKAGGGVGLNNDGERWQARVQGTLRF